MFTDALVLVMVGALAVLLPRNLAYRRYLTRGLADQSGAAVSAEQRATLESRVAQRATGMGTGILVAGLIVLVVDRLWRAPQSMTGLGLILALMFVFGAAGIAVVEIWRPGTPAEGPRTARARTPRAGDYLPSLLSLGAAAYTGIGLVAVLGTLLLARSQWFDTVTVLWSPVAVIAVAIPVLIVLTWLAVRRVLDAPQPARDESELYWQDALRAQTLSSLLTPTPLVAIVGLVVCGSVLDAAASLAATARGTVGPGWSLAVLVAGYGVPFVLVTFGLVVMAGPWGTPPARHFRDRLWGGRVPRPASE